MPTEIRWRPPVALSPEEVLVARKLTRIGKFDVFLREVRAELFDASFQAEWAAGYQPRGTAPLPAALLALVTLLQAYDQVGDAEAVNAAQVDQRWQLALGCLRCTRAPFSQGALVKFRERMIAHDLDQKLLDRTVALAKQTGRFGWQALRASLDSSPVAGAGRVQDIRNLIGRALATVAICPATAVRRPRAKVLREAAVTLVAAPSLKAALDIDWDDPAAQAAALARLLAEVDRLEQWVAATHARREHATPALQAALTASRR
jgi:transposase